MLNGPREEFSSRLTSLLRASGLQQQQAAARVMARRPNSAGWRLDHRQISSWRNGRHLPVSDAAFMALVRLLTEHARGRAARGHQVGELLDEIAWSRLLERARSGPSETSDPAESSRLPIPAQLPISVSDFTGRDAELGRLDQLLSGPRPAQDAQTTAVVTAIGGMGGVGKTTLAVEWAHRVKDHFLDGQLYVNLHGYGPGQQLTPAEALDGFLRALHLAPEAIPPTERERAALFRSLVSDRRILILIDNAASAAQVRPLLPGTTSCFVIVTSRSALHGLAVSSGAVRVSLDVFTHTEACELLTSIVGIERAAEEPEAVANLVRLCGRLPLALKVIGHRAVSRPQLSLTALAADLGSGDRLAALRPVDDDVTTVSSVLSWSYLQLTDQQAAFFPHLGLHTGPSLTQYSAAALAGIDPSEAKNLMEALCDFHLLESVADGRFQLHDLLREYARALAEEEGDIKEPAGRLVGFYLHSAHSADRLLFPHRRNFPRDGAPEPPWSLPELATYTQALAWCDAERMNLVAAVRIASETGYHKAAWQLATNLWDFFNIRSHLSDWAAVTAIGLDSARTIQDRFGEARMLNALGCCYASQGRYSQSMVLLQESLALSRRYGYRHLEGVVLGNMGDTLRAQQSYSEAIPLLEQGLAIRQEFNDQWGEAMALSNLGSSYLGLGKAQKAIDYLIESTRLCRATNQKRGEDYALATLAETFLALKQYDRAIQHAHEALKVCRITGSYQDEGVAHHVIALAHIELGDPETASPYLEAAAAIFDHIAHPRAAMVRAQLRAVAR